MTRVVLHIDRLVLHGVPAAQRDTFVAQLQAALAQQFAAPGVAEAWAGAGHRAWVRRGLPASATAPAAAHALALLAQPEPRR